MIGTIVDELMTPGCPQCAVKHLSAALMYQARAFATENYAEHPPAVSAVRILMARAFINLGEVLIGYKSHLWYAVGLLQSAEEIDLLEEGTDGKIARELRLELEVRGADGARDAAESLFYKVPFFDSELEIAHYEEARRELPSWREWSPDYAGTIEKIREEYFVSEEAPGASAEAAEKGGESDMATKKAAKADPKAAKAAAKGGKAKQACGKGGCAKKGKK